MFECMLPGSFSSSAFSRSIPDAYVGEWYMQDPIDEIAGIDVVANEKKKIEITAAISNSFGFGGHNSSCIFAPYVA